MLRVIFAAAAALASTSAFAHHPMGGETPSTIAQGLLSGIGHPVLGLDHLAFVIAVGVAAYVAGSRYLLPLAFVGATVAGTLVHLAAIDLVAVEAVIALSVATVGIALAFGTKLPTFAWGALFAVAGLFHGHAYGEAIFGAETTPVLAYLVGFGLTQWAIAVGAGALVVAMLGRSAGLATNLPARVAGGMVAGAGLMIVGEQAIAAAFA